MNVFKWKVAVVCPKTWCLIDLERGDRAFLVACKY
jgi:hypothetical protein